METIKFLFSGEAKFAFLIYFGLVTFAIAILIGAAISLYSAYWRERYIQKHHFDIWKIPDGKSFKKVVKYRKAVNSLNDPVLKEVSTRLDNYAKLCLLIWFILFLLVGTVVLTLHLLGI